MGGMKVTLRTRWRLRKPPPRRKPRKLLLPRICLPARRLLLPRIRPPPRRPPQRRETPRRRLLLLRKTPRSAKPAPRRVPRRKLRTDLIFDIHILTGIIGVFTLTRTIAIKI